MTVVGDQLARDYAAALRDYLTGAGEEALARGYELGRAAAARGIGVIDMSMIHHDAMLRVGAVDANELLSFAARFFAEALSPFEMTHRGFADANRELRDKNRALDAANRELEAFSYSVSHDLRTPLRAIDGFSQALVEDYADRLDARGTDYLRRVRAAAQRMGELIDAMLSLSRITRVPVKRERVDLGEVARAVADELTRRAGDRAVTFAIAPDLIAEADPQLVRVLLDNLIGNAWKFTAKTDGARIEIGSTVDKETVFFVRDNGAGFDMQYADKLFAPFQRLHTDADFAGTGIGLATVRRVVDRHGGRVWAEGEPGRGATISFTLAPGGAR